jgi:hypothetical protein
VHVGCRTTYYVAWWNLENLFGEENSPRWTENCNARSARVLAGWTPARRDRKVSQLASVIAQMNNGPGPDLLGVCEVENRFVLDLLVATLATPLPGRNSASSCGSCAGWLREEGTRGVYVANLSCSAMPSCRNLPRIRDFSIELTGVS